MKKEITVADIGEKRIIREIIRPICKDLEVEVGIGDDAAILAFPADCRLVISTDKIPEDLLSLQLGLMDPFNHGRYLATVNISDVAAMGGRPLGLLCTLALPDSFELNYLRSFMEGFAAGGNEWGVPVVGGDTGWATSVCLSATAFGAIEAGGQLLRSGAGVGDFLFVSGEIGGFGAALAYFIVARPNGLLLNNDEEAYLQEKLIRPIARVDVGRALLTSGDCSSCMDITDGTGQSLRELAEASNVRLEIDYDALPINPIVGKVAKILNSSVEKIVFGIGLDLELLGTTRSMSQGVSSGLKYFGRVVAGEPGVTIDYGSHKGPIPVSGWQHFTGSAMDKVRQMYPI